ncbi:hypothetical protein RUND412_004039 [Rhizina undulata]
MAAQAEQSAPSASSGNNASEIFHVGTPTAISGPYNISKNPYRHSQAHHAAVAGQQFSSMMTAGGPISFPAHMASPIALQNAQFYTPVNASSYPHVYNTGMPHDHPYYVYHSHHHASWPVAGSVGVYPQQGYGHSPPSTPPQNQMPYGYQVAPGSEYFGPVLPALDHRRNSWSSSGASDSPATPYMPAAHMASNPIIAGESHHPNFASNNNENGKNFNVYGKKKSVESLILAGPPLPRPIPAVYSPEFPRTLHDSLENPTNTTNVYIRGLPPDTDDDKLYEMTCRFGVVTSHKAIMDTEHGTCKGYGFARYETKEEAEDCIRGLVSLKYEAGFARESFNARLKTLADPNSTNVYVSNLPRNMNEKDMQDIFAGYVVVSNRILRDTNGNSRGVGFARFEDRSICDEIIKNFHGKPVGDEQMALQVRYADTSAQKRLKATTTKKRQFRTNEYNSVVNGAWCVPASGPLIQPSIPQYRNRVWLRQNSMNSNFDSANAHPQNSRLNGNDWNKSQDWKNAGKENRTADWKPVSWATVSTTNGKAAEKNKLETVLEDRDDNISECHSEVTTVPTVLDYGGRTVSVGKASSGSFSDPGDSYGGREKLRGGDETD